MEKDNLKEKKRIELSFSNWALVLLTAFNIFLFWKPFAKDEFEISCDPELYIQRRLGNIHFFQSFSIRNIGNSRGYITKIECLIRSKDRDISVFKKRIIAKRYIDGNNESVPFLQISLNEKEVFNTEFCLFKDPDRMTKDSIAVLQALMINEVQERQKKMSIPNFNDIEASGKLSSSIETFTKNRTQEFIPGEYEYIIAVTKNNEESAFYKSCYSFFIYPDNIFVMNEAIKDYKRYNALVRNNLRPSIQIPLTEIKNQNIINSLELDLKNASQ